MYRLHPVRIPETIDINADLLPPLNKNSLTEEHKVN